MIEQFLKRIAKGLDRQGIPYIIIGGQAALIHGRPRLTEDVDVTLGIDTDEFPKLFEECRNLKLTPLRANPEEFAEKTKVLPMQDPESKLRVDFIFSNTPYEQVAIKRAVLVEMADYPVRFASPEDLVIHKLFAGRAIDLEDAEAVLLRQGNKLDRAYVRKWLKVFGTTEEGKDLLTVWSRLPKPGEK